MPSELPQPDAGTAWAVLALLRGQAPPDAASPGAAQALLRQLECGGYLRELWGRAGRLDSLPHGWAEALESAHRKTALDTLAALADFRAFGRHLEAGRFPCILLKGSSYLFDLYDDPGQRSLTDIDLLIRPSDALPLYRALKGAGYTTLQWDDEYRRFEVVAQGGARCSFEVHWRLGLTDRDIDQEDIWSRSRPAVLEEIPCRRLAPTDAVLYHVAHQADHFFAPSLKWSIDLRLMFQRWALDHDTLLARAGEWGVRTPLCLAARYNEKLFPGEVPASLLERLQLGSIRRWLLGPFLDAAPLRLMNVGNGRLARYGAACVLRDRFGDVLTGLARSLKRPFLRHFARPREDGAPPPLWH